MKKGKELMGTDNNVVIVGGKRVAGAGMEEGMRVNGNKNTIKM